MPNETAGENPARIVVVEDNPGDVALLRYALSEHGNPFALEVLTDGEQAMAFIEREKSRSNLPRPCVIVLDLHLPKYDGTAVLRTIKSDPVLRHIRVAVVTTLGSPDEEATVIRVGADLYRTKPADLDDWTVFAREVADLCSGLSIGTTV